MKEKKYLFALILVSIMISVILILNTNKNTDYENTINTQGFSVSDNQLNTTGNIYVNVNPHSSNIFIDNIKINDTTPLTIMNLRTGIHEILAYKEGYKDFSISVNVETNRTTQLFVTLPNQNDNLVQGSLYVLTDIPDSKIFLDGILLGTSPIYKSTIPGIKTIKSTKKGFYENSKSIEVIEGYNTYVELEVSSQIKSKQELGSLEILTVPNKLEIRLDNKLIGISPMIIYSILGQHAISASKDGITIASKEIMLNTNGRSKIELSQNEINVPESKSIIEDMTYDETKINSDSNLDEPSSGKYLIFILIISVLVIILILKKKKSKT